MFRRIRQSLCLLFAFVLTLPIHAQTLIDRVPSDAVLYAAWRGTNDLGPDYQGSNLEGMLQQVGLLQLIPEAIQLIQQLENQGEIAENEAQMIAMAATILTSTWAEGGAMYILPPAPQGPPIPRLCILWNQAKEQDALRQAINTAATILQQQLPAFAGDLDGVPFLSIGFNPDGMTFKSLSADPHFKATTQQIQADAALMVYADAKQWIKEIDQFVKTMQQQAEQHGGPMPDPVQFWPTVRDAVGLGGLESIALSAGLKDKNWHTQLFIGAPAPRRGALALLDNKPIAPINLQHIPKSATYLQAFSMQPSRVLDVTKDIAGKIDPHAIESINAILKEANDEVGFDLEKDLIDGLGPLWSAYIDPMIAGNGFASMVLVNELKDSNAVHQAMLKLSSKANELFAEEDDVKIRFMTRKIQGVAVTYLGIPFVAPAWAIHNNRLYVALYPQALEMAIEHSGKRRDSILANKAFQDAMARFADNPAKQANALNHLKHATGISFANLPETATDGYGTTMALMQLLSGAGEMMTGEPSAVRMPPVGKLLPYLEVSGSATRVTDQGLHIHSVEPFPGATLLSASKGMTTGAGMTTPMTIAILLPALGAARTEAQAMQAHSQARLLSMAHFAYAADHKDAYPGDIAQLNAYLDDADLLISPRSTRSYTLPENFNTLPEAKQNKLMRTHSSFVIVPLGQMNEVEAPSDTIMFFERPDDTSDTELIVAMADGSVRRMTEQNLAQSLEQQGSQTIKQLIHRQENFGQ